MITLGLDQDNKSSPAGLIRRVLLRPLGAVGFVLVGAWIIVGALAPWISPFDPISQNAPLLQAPSAQHLLGTDELGRDLLSRLVWGARLSLPLAALLGAGL